MHSNPQNPFENTSIPLPGYNREGDRIWGVMEFTPDNLAMIIHWRRETPESVSEKCEKLSAIQIRKMMGGERVNPGQKTLRQLQNVLKILFITL